jgi:exodeoxyribonuclease-3
MEDQVETAILEQMGYHHYWFSAQKKGYSGVAIFSRKKPNNITYGSGIDHMDFEGRILRVDFDEVSIMSLYLPSGTNLARLDYKFQFMDEFQEYINKLKSDHPNLIICGDYNICHQAIDIHDPIRNKNVSVFLPEEREWLDNFLKAGFIDSFRHLNSDPHQYSWWSYRANARNNNKGWRIDYALVSKNLEKKIVRSFILPEAKHSDHCPVGLELKF